MLVDDEPDILEFLGYNLKKEGYQVFTCSSGDEAIKAAKTIIPDLIILDVMMPGLDGVETCKELKLNPNLNKTVVALLSARNEDYTQIAGLDAGADDYITKPIKPRLFMAKVKSLLRRDITHHDEQDLPPLPSGLEIDLERYLVKMNGKEIVLPKKEFKLFALLFSKPENVFTREIILEEVWGDEVIVGDRTIDVHIRKLREKIGSDYFITIKGVGYKFVNTSK